MSTPRPIRRATTLAVLAALVAAAAPAQAQTLLGVYYGNQGWKMDQVRAMEAWQGKRHAVVNVFTDWCSRTKTLDNLFKQQLPNVWASGNVPLVTWEPYLCSPAATPADVEVRAARGDYDAYVGTWATRLRAFVSGPNGHLGDDDDRRVYLRLAHEMNGDWYPWGAAVGNNSPGDYVRMWLRVRAMFAQQGLDARTVQWIWAVNHEDVGSWRAEDYYPGDAHVDWIGIDGYNWGTSQSWSSWRTPQEVFATMIARLRALPSTKPLALTETASSTATTGGPNVAAKSQWIGDFFAYATSSAGARMVVWFNEDKETDWAVFGGSAGDETYRSGRTGYKAYKAYRMGVQPGTLVGPTAGHPRLLGDAAFAGQP